MNPELDRLHPYPFEKLNAIKAGLQPPADLPHIALSIGEPKHSSPHFVSEALISHLHGLANYPVTKGSPELRQAIARWLEGRFALGTDGVDAEQQIIPVNGTREALFAFAQAVVDRSRTATVMMPNPFYQIYEGAAILAGAEPHYLNTGAQNDFSPDFEAISEAQWQACQLVYICSPGNPTGKVLGRETLKFLIEKSDQYDFLIASDECYSEIYFDEAEPPLGLLQAAAEMGRQDFRNCVVFHSLSKRSNLPGLRSGFVAGDAEALKKFLLYRTYHGCAMAPPIQAASITAWQDEQHVLENRQLYRQKFDAVLEILSPVMAVERPDAGFYLWAPTPMDDVEFARRLFAEKNVTVLPGQYLSRQTDGHNPGQGRVRMALVATLDECIEAAQRIRDFVQNL